MLFIVVSLTMKNLVVSKSMNRRCWKIETRKSVRKYVDLKVAALNILNNVGNIFIRRASN